MDAKSTYALSLDNVTTIPPCPQPTPAQPTRAQPTCGRLELKDAHVRWLLRLLTVDPILEDDGGRVPPVLLDPFGHTLVEGFVREALEEVAGVSAAHTRAGQRRKSDDSSLRIRCGDSRLHRRLHRLSDRINKRIIVELRVLVHLGRVEDAEELVLRQRPCVAVVGVFVIEHAVLKSVPSH